MRHVFGNRPDRLVTKAGNEAGHDSSIVESSIDGSKMLLLGMWTCEKNQFMGTSGKPCCKGHMAALCRAWTKLATRRSNDPECRWCFHQPNSKWTPFHLFWWYWNQHLEGNLHTSKGKARRVERVYQAVKECQRTRSESDVVIFFRVLFRFQEKQTKQSILYHPLPLERSFPSPQLVTIETDICTIQLCDIPRDMTPLTLGRNIQNYQLFWCLTVVWEVSG